MLWAWLSQAWSAWRPALVLVKPETVLTWHRRGFRLFWTWKSRNRTGRPAVAPEVCALIRRMATANPLWGAPRIHGELLTLGISVSQATVAKYMPWRDSPPSQPWRTFLATHVGQIMAADFFVVPTAVTYSAVVHARHPRAEPATGSFTSLSPDIPRLHGRPSNSATPFPRTKRRGTWCTTAMPHSRTSCAPSARCRSTSSSRRRDPRGRTPMSNVSSARSDVSASIT
jgi:hypothetical protein